MDSSWARDFEAIDSSWARDFEATY
jgi:hypothetical protein